MFKRFGILLLITSGMLWTFAQEGEETEFIRAYFTHKSMAHQVFERFDAQRVEIFYEDQYMIFMDMIPSDIAYLEDQNFVVVPDRGYDIHHNRSYDANQRIGIPGYPSYLLVEETFAWAESVATALPDLAEFIDVGDSWDKTQGSGGYDNMVLVLTNSKIPGPKPKLFICGAQHAREYTTSELARRFALYLIENYGKDPDATWMLDYHEYHAMFFINPDGRKYAEKGQLWRKNTNADYCPSDYNKRGADLNRNYDRSWGSMGSSDECNLTFWGASAASEPEVQAVQNYMQTIFKDNPKQGIHIDLHSYGEIIYKPSDMSTLARKFNYFNGYDARDSRGGQGYEYGYYVVGTPSCLFELGTSFFQKCDYFENTILPDNLKAFIYALKSCRDPVNIAQGPDPIDVSISGNTLTATIDDTRYGSSVTTHNISEAEYYIGTPPWRAGATPIPMSAKDGSFDEKKEEVEATLISSDLPRDNVLIYVRGKDSDDNWGIVSAVFHDMTNTVSTPEIYNGPVQLSHPNPLIFPATLSIQVPETAHLHLAVFTMQGKNVATLANSTLQVGNHSIHWDGKDTAGNDLAGGIYLYRLHVGGFLQMGRFVIAQ